MDDVMRSTAGAGTATAPGEPAGAEVLLLRDLLTQASEALDAAVGCIEDDPQCALFDLLAARMLLTTALGDEDAAAS